MKVILGGNPYSHDPTSMTFTRFSVSYVRSYGPYEMVDLAGLGRSVCLFRRETLLNVIVHILFTLGDARGGNYGNENTGSCPDGANVDLTDVTENESGFTTHDGLFFPRDLTKLKDGVLQGCICDLKPCINLCYPPEDEDDEFWVDHPAIPKIHHANLTLEDEENAPSLDERFHYIHLVPCDPNTSFQLDPKTVPDDEFYLLGNGSLLLPHVEAPHSVLHSERYCLDYDANYTTYHPHVCLGPNDNPTAKKPKIEEENDPVQHDASDDVVLRKATYIASLVSIPFLVATVIVYSILPELINIHGAILRCYLCTLIVGYVALATAGLLGASLTNGSFCVFVGFTIYCSVVASFFWLNVMCIDTWLRFGGFKRTSNLCSPQNDRKRFIVYSVYAWGATSLMTAICIGMELSLSLPESVIRPGFRQETSCWFGTRLAVGLYLYLIIGSIVLCNVCLFISTTIKIFELRRAVQRNPCNNDHHTENKYWFRSHLKLFVIMGVTWSAEIISYLWEGQGYLWLVTDMVNALQGILIFIIFVCERRVWRFLKKRFTKLRNMRTSNSHNDETCISLNSSPNAMVTGILDEEQN